MTRPLKVGIVSANWGALAHLPAWRSIDGVEVSAICTSRPETAEAAAAQFQVDRPFWDYEAMCADPDLDIIDVGTNPVLREKIVAAALAGGKHVVNNLPFATSAQAAQTLADQQKAIGVYGAAASSLMGLPHLHHMKDLIDAGEIGEVYQVDCAWELSFFLEIMPGFPYIWFGKGGLGVGVTRNHGSHMLHALRHLFGPIHDVSAQIATQHKLWQLGDGQTMIPETDDTCHALLRFQNGIMGNMRASWTAADSPGFSLDVKGSKGRLRLTSLLYPSIHSASLYHATASAALTPSGTILEIPEALMRVSGRILQPEASDLMNGGQRVSIARLFESLVTAIQTGSTPLASFERSAEIQAIVEALHLSHDKRQWVRTAPFAA